jgi:hypothetical protein
MFIYEENKNKNIENLFQIKITNFIKYQAKIAKHHKLEYHDPPNFQTEIVMNFKFNKEEKYEITDNKKKVINDDVRTKAKQ